MISAYTLTTLLLGIVFLMTTKPSLVTSILVMGVALLFGLFVSFLFWAARRRRAGQPGDHSTEADPFLKQSLWTRRW
jgi:protein-S-isoprenylcysteine O-methyltransferase Ste14